MKAPSKLIQEKKKQFSSADRFGAYESSGHVIKNSADPSSLLQLGLEEWKSRTDGDESRGISRAFLLKFQSSLHTEPDLGQGHRASSEEEAPGTECADEQLSATKRFFNDGCSRQTSCGLRIPRRSVEQLMVAHVMHSSVKICVDIRML